MHKWKYRIDSNSIKIFKTENVYDSNKAIAIVNTEYYGEVGVANAKRICQTHNSFDGLLEALDKVIKWDDTMQILPPSLEIIIKSAIAQAEE